MTVKSSGPLALSEINTEFGGGTNLNSYRGIPWYTTTTSGAFSTGAITVNDFYNKRVISPNYTISSPHAGQWAWGYNGYGVGKFGADQTARGGIYISRQIYGSTTMLDGYGNPYAGTGLYYPGNAVANSYDTVSFTNKSAYAVDVELQVNVGRATDDGTRNVVFRNGSIANISTHSGGTVILDTGGQWGATYFTVVDSVPANTTYTWYNYCGIVNGSSTDGCTSWINLKRLSNTGERVSSPHAGQWAWGHNTYTVGKYGGNQTARGAYYISRQIYGATTVLDGYGNPVAGTGLYYPGNAVANSYDTVTWTNSKAWAIDVELEIIIGRSTDDVTRNLVYRNGSIANISTHSGGALILDTGNTTGTRFTVNDTIPANTTYTWYNYSGVVNGSGGDGNTSWINLRVI